MLYGWLPVFLFIVIWLAQYFAGAKRMGVFGRRVFNRGGGGGRKGRLLSSPFNELLFCLAKPFIEKQKLQHYLDKGLVKTVVGNQANWGPNINIALMYRYACL